MLVLLSVVTAVAAVRGMWSPCGLSMLSALNPVAERARGHRFAVTACWYLLGAASGGALLGAGCAAGAAAVAALDVGDRTAWLVALAAGAVATLSDARVGGWSLPIQPRQVDERWLTRYRRWLYAGGYGAQIGTGFATYIMTAGVYLLAVLAVLTADPAAAFAAGLAFGVLRGACIVVAGTARTPERLAALLARVDALAPTSAAVAGTACAAVPVVAAWALGGAAAAAVSAAGLGAVAAWGATRSRGYAAASPRDRATAPVGRSRRAGRVPSLR